ALTLPALARAANENVTVYGAANVSYDVINTGSTTGTGAAAGTSSSRLSSNSSRLGVKGSHELGSDWSGLWQIESTVGTDTGASGGVETATGESPRSTRLFDRNTYVGLSKADKGKLLAGRHDTPYKLSTRRLDVFADGIADNRSLMGTTIAGGVVKETFDGRLSNMIAYFSPSFGSFSGAIGYANLAESSINASQDRVSALSMAGMYEQDALYATFAYEGHTTTFIDTNRLSRTIAIKAFKLGLGYTASFYSVGFAYEKSRDDFGNISAATTTNPCGNMSISTNCSGHGTLYLSGKLSFTADDAVKIAIGKAGQVGAASGSTAALQFSMGYDHEIDKRTSAYFLYTSLKNDPQVNYGLSSAATSGDYSVNSTGAGGAAPSAFSFGVKHSF
ncbi:MAG: porin, partial [Gallionella sp.]